MILILSLFPGIGMLDRAVQEVFSEACLVRGPDLLWGGDARSFHAPPGRFEAVIGGPPCQEFSSMAHMVRAKGHKPRFGNLIPDFQRIVEEAAPAWFLMENVRGAPIPRPEAYGVHSFLLGNHRLAGADGFGLEQKRDRRWIFGVRDRDPVDLRQWIDYAALELPMASATVWSQGINNSPEAKGRVGAGLCVVAGHGPTSGQRVKTSVILSGGQETYSAKGRVKKGNRYSIEQMCRLQGFPEDFCKYMPFTMEGKRAVIGNGVPLLMGQAIARAIRRALGG